MLLGSRNFVKSEDKMSMTVGTAEYCTIRSRQKHQLLTWSPLFRSWLYLEGIWFEYLPSFVLPCLTFYVYFLIFF